MSLSGPIILAFVIFHLLNLTTGTIHPRFVELRAYENLVNNFTVIPISLVYIVCMLLIGTHLSHGIWSMFQSIGWVPRTGYDWRRPLATTVSLAVAIGNISFPIAVLAGVIH